MPFCQSGISGAYFCVSMAKFSLNIFRKKSADLPANVDADAPIQQVPKEYWHVLTDVARALNLSPKIVTSGHLWLFMHVAEVFFPIDFIASRIANAHYELKRVNDDSLVWCTGRSYKAQKIAKILSRPNPLQTFSQFVYMHFVNKLASGDGIMRSAMSELISKDTPKWKMCDNFWSIPTPLVSIETKGTNIPLYGICDLDELIKGYTIGGNQRLIPAWQIFHDRDTYPNFNVDSDTPFLMSASRLDALKDCVSTLRAAYDARNIIFNRCGALGILTNKAKDVTGHIAMTQTEKDELLQQFNGKYGVTGNKSPIALTDADLAYLRTGMSIAELQPFEESLMDAITIAGQYGIPADLVPRKDNSTYDNKAAAEKGVYTGVIIPMAKQFCQDFTEFLGIENAGYYIDCNFDDVDCLQVGRKEKETVKTMVNDRCRQQFLDGLITINDWRGQIHEAALEGDVYNKVKFEMTDDELSFIGRVINSNSNNLNPQLDNGKDNEESAGADENE